MAMSVTLTYQLLSIFRSPTAPTTCAGQQKKTNVSGRAQGRPGGGGAGASDVADTPNAPGEIDDAPGEIETGEEERVTARRRRCGMCGMGEAGGVAAIVLCAIPSSAVDIWLLVSVEGGKQGLPGEEIKALWYSVFGGFT